VLLQLQLLLLEQQQLQLQPWVLSWLKISADRMKIVCQRPRCIQQQQQHRQQHAQEEQQVQVNAS
jgi:hypothetical protein